VPFNITNQGNNTIELTAIVKRFEASSEENGQVVYVKPGLVDERTKDSFLQGIQIVDNGFSVSGVTLSPKQEKKLEITISLAKNTPPEDHYFSLIFLTKADEEAAKAENTEKETISYVQAGISLPVLLAVETSRKETAFIEEFSAPVFSQSGPIPFTIKIKNSGTHFTSPKAVILIENMFGQTVGRINVPATNVLANTSRFLTDNSKAESTPNILWSEKILFGFYKANLTLLTSDNQLLYTRSIHFLAFPFVFLAGFFVGIVILFILLRRIKNKLSEE
jgi:hypothetical protein